MFDILLAWLLPVIRTRNLVGLVDPLSFLRTIQNNDRNFYCTNFANHLIVFSPLFDFDFRVHISNEAP